MKIVVFIIALSAFILLLWIINNQVKKTNWYKNAIPNSDNYPTNEWYRAHLERNFDVINIGSSSAKYAFDYSECNVKAFNWAGQPQSLTYGYRILQNYFSILKNGGYVIISLGPLSGLNVDSTWNKTANDHYYYILDSTLIDNYDEIAKRRKYPLLYQPKDGLKRLLKDVKKRTAVDTHICTTEAAFEKDAKNWVNNWMKQFDIKDLDASLSAKNLEGRSFRINLLSQIIGFCMERELKPVIVIPPIHPALSSKFSLIFRENYIYSFIQGANTKNIPFFDFMDDSRFLDGRYYYNSFLMNEVGAKKFTRELLNDIVK